MKVKDMETRREAIKGGIRLPRSMIDEGLWRDKDMGALVWFLIANADDNGELDISQRKLASALGISTRCLRRLIDECSAKHILKRETKRETTHLTIFTTNDLEEDAKHILKRSTKHILKRIPEESNDTLLVAETVDAEDIDFSQLTVFFNNAVRTTAISQIRGIDDKRRKAVMARCREHGKHAVMDAIRKAVSSDFCNGTETKWKCSFDWIFNKSNFLKIIEGNYDNRTDTQRHRPSRTCDDRPHRMGAIAEEVLRITSGA